MDSQQDNMDTTPDPKPQTHHQAQYEDHLQNGTAYQPRPTTSQSAEASYSPQTEMNSFSNLSHQHAAGLQTSRPPSGLSDATSRQAGGYSHHHSNGQEKTAQNSVVIKVGMVGDAQIGKTSLMVKYVEGSWDEDYIQTLGES